MHSFKSKSKAPRKRRLSSVCQRKQVVEAASKNKENVVGVISDHQSTWHKCLQVFSEERSNSANVLPKFPVDGPGTDGCLGSASATLRPGKNGLELSKVDWQKLSVVDVTEGNEIPEELNKVPKGAGVLVLPIDLVAQRGQEIITCRKQIQNT